MVFVSGCCSTDRGGSPTFTPVMIGVPFEDCRIEIFLSIQDDGVVQIACNAEDVHVKSFCVLPYICGEAEVSFKSDGELCLNDAGIVSAIYNEFGNELWVAREMYFAGLRCQACGHDRAVPTSTQMVRLPVKVRDVKCVRCDVRLERGSAHEVVSIYAFSSSICKPAPLLLL